MNNNYYKCVGGPFDGRYVSLSSHAEAFRVPIGEIDEMTLRIGTYAKKRFCEVVDGHRRDWFEWHFYNSTEVE